MGNYVDNKSYGKLVGLRAWLYCKGKQNLSIVLWVIFNIVLMAYFIVEYQNNPKYVNSRNAFGWSFIVARSSAGMIHVCTIFILLPLCRHLLTKLRATFINRFVPFDSNISFHKIVGIEILVFSVVHTLGHYFNYYKLSKTTDGQYSFLYLLVNSGPSWTGHLMLLCLLLICIPALDVFRQKNFNRFWYLHQLFFIFLLLFSFHGSFCLLKAPNPPYCAPNSSFWKYYVASGVLYLTERLIREFSTIKHPKGCIIKVVLHPARVVEIQMRRDALGNYKPGQYVFINCPAVSVFEWHPFTLTSAPEEGFVSVHIRAAGDWTEKFAKSLGIKSFDIEIPVIPGRRLTRLNTEYSDNLTNRMSRYIELPDLDLPEISVDGPHGSPAEDAFDFNVAVLIGAGIGVTPFASILKSLWYKYNSANSPSKLQKIYFIWTQKEPSSVVWFHDLLIAIEEEETISLLNTGKYYSISNGLNEKIIEITIYVTNKFRPEQITNLIYNDKEGDQDAITRLRAPTFYGRPNFGRIFKNIAKSHPKSNVGVFFCGPKAMGNNIDACVYDITAGNPFGTKFKYHEEYF